MNNCIFDERKVVNKDKDTTFDCYLMLTESERTSYFQVPMSMCVECSWLTTDRQYAWKLISCRKFR